MSGKFLRMVLVDKLHSLPMLSKHVALTIYTAMDSGNIKISNYYGLPWSVITEKQTGWLKSKLQNNLAHAREWLTEIKAIYSPAAIPVMVDKRLEKMVQLIENLINESAGHGEYKNRIYCLGYGNIVLLGDNLYKSRDGYIGLCAIGTIRRGYFIVGMADDENLEIYSVNENMWKNIITASHNLSAIALYIDRNAKVTNFNFYRWGEMEPVLATIPDSIRILDSWLIGNKLVAKMDETK